jgi:hypothetical protein
VNTTVAVVDNADPQPEWSLVSVTSSEADNGLGDGDTPNDIQIVNDRSFNLRAERGGGEGGRVYTITYQATDACGNSSEVQATVTVPANQAQAKAAGIMVEESGAPDAAGEIFRQFLPQVQQ